MSRLQTMARFAEPKPRNTPDLTGWHATMHLTDVDICGGMCVVPACDVRIFGTGDKDVFDVTDVRIQAVSLVGNPNPLAKILFDAIADSITTEQGEAALLGSYEAA